MQFLLDISNIQWPLLAGVIASMVHVWAGPDHLAAVAPLVFERAKKQWKIGTAWGLGHVSGMLLIGLLYYIFKDLIPVESLSENSEVLVGFILITIGIRATYRAHKKQKQHEHKQQDNQDIYNNLNAHHHNEHAYEPKTLEQQDAKTAVGIGIIHGFAGISHFLIMLPVLGYHSDLESSQYLAGFALGTVLAMAFFAWFLGIIQGIPSHKHRPRFLKILQWSGGLMAIFVGALWLVI